MTPYILPSSSSVRRCLGALSLLMVAWTCSALTIPGDTAIPVVFTKTVSAKKAKTGDAITAKTIQAVKLPDGESIPKGSRLIGHIVQATPFHFDDTPYATQKPSVLAVHFDRIVVNGTETPVNLTVRALANHNDAESATFAHNTDESDHLGTMVLVGGAHFSPISKQVLSGDDDIVGYNRKGGVFAHLLPGVYQGRGAGFHCGGTSTEQSVAIFSPDACGLYGFDNTSLSAADGNATFRLSSGRYTVTLYAGSAALLQSTSPSTPQS
jgi:hypothetical protein